MNRESESRLHVTKWVISPYKENWCTLLETKWNTKVLNTKESDRFGDSSVKIHTFITKLERRAEVKDDV